MAGVGYRANLKGRPERAAVSNWPTQGFTLTTSAFFRKLVAGLQPPQDLKLDNSRQYVIVEAG